MGRRKITEQMLHRQKICEYAKEHGVTAAAREYNTNRMFVYRQLARWDGTPKSLALKSRRPHCYRKKRSKKMSE